MNVELAEWNASGSWDWLGSDYTSVEDAIEAAKRLGAAAPEADGSAKYGISADPGSGHYEIEILVSPDGAARFDEGVYVGQV